MMWRDMLHPSFLKVQASQVSQSANAAMAVKAAVLKKPAAAPKVKMEARASKIVVNFLRIGHACERAQASGVMLCFLFSCRCSRLWHSRRGQAASNGSSRMRRRLRLFGLLGLLGR